MKIESKFKEGNATYIVQKYPNGKYYNSELNKSSTYINIGPFDTTKEAEQMLKKHRPAATKIQPYSRKTRKPKKVKKNEVRTHKKSGHPSYIREQIGDDFIYTGLTHSDITNRNKNTELKQNPNPEDKEPAFAVNKIKKEPVKNFKKKKTGWKVGRKDKKKLNIRDRKKLKNLK